MRCDDPRHALFRLASAYDTSFFALGPRLSVEGMGLPPASANVGSVPIALFHLGMVVSWVTVAKIRLE